LIYPLTRQIGPSLWLTCTLLVLVWLHRRGGFGTLLPWAAAGLGLAVQLAVFLIPNQHALRRNYGLHEADLEFVRQYLEKQPGNRGRCQPFTPTWARSGTCGSI